MTGGAAVEPLEATEIPVNGKGAYLGAASFLAALAYPGTRAADHAKRDQLIDAVQDWIHGYHKAQQGMRRVTHRRAKVTDNAWIAYQQTMKDAKAFATLNRAARIIIDRRFLAAQLAQQLGLIYAARTLRKNKSAMRLTVGGPRSLSAILEESPFGGDKDARTLWRYWQESLPVLHLACALHRISKPNQYHDRYGLVIGSVRSCEDWLAKAVVSAESSALHYLPRYTNFAPAARIALVAEK